MRPSSPRLPTRLEKPSAGKVVWIGSLCQPGIFLCLDPGPWSWLETSDGADGIIIPISCDTQIDCRQGDITRALVLHVIRVFCVCVFLFFPILGSSAPSSAFLCREPAGCSGKRWGLASRLPMPDPAQGYGRT